MAAGTCFLHEWQAVQDLVEPIIEERKRTQQEQDIANRQTPEPVRQLSRRRLWVAVSIVLLVVAFAPLLRAIYLNRRHVSAETVGTMERERAERIEDFIAEGRVVPGMSPAEVIRVRGLPTRKEATPETQSEQWFYSRQVVLFEHGIVTQISDARQSPTRRQ